VFTEGGREFCGEVCQRENRQFSRPPHRRFRLDGEPFVRPRERGYRYFFVVEMGHLIEVGNTGDKYWSALPQP